MAANNITDAASLQTPFSSPTVLGVLQTPPARRAPPPSAPPLDILSLRAGRSNGAAYR
jgi:hypothetical protein